MAKANLKIIAVLERTIKKLQNKNTKYDWKMIGCCNAGCLIRAAIPGLSVRDLHIAGIQKHGDWEMLETLYRERSTYKIDNILSELYAMGFEQGDFTEVENLSNEEILSRIEREGEAIKRDNRENVIRYFKAWAQMLREKYTEKVKLPEMEENIA